MNCCTECGHRTSTVDVHLTPTSRERRFCGLCVEDLARGGHEWTAPMVEQRCKALEALLVFVQLHAPTPEARQRHDEDERGWNLALHGAVDLAIRVLLQSEHEARVRETVKQAAWEHLYRDEAKP